MPMELPSTVRGYRPPPRRWPLAVVAIVVAIAGLGFGYRWLVDWPNAGGALPQLFSVPSGMGSMQISGQLKAQGLVRSRWLLLAYLWTNGLNQRLLPGDYDVPANLSTAQIAALLAAGPNNRERQFTIIEGWTLREMAGYFEREGIVRAQDFLAVTGKKADWWDDYPVLASRPRSVDLEGYLFPDTYRIFREATSTVIVQKMLGTMEQKLSADLREQIQRQGRSLHAVITLASIVEAEVAKPEDRPVVAGIFAQRLERGIPLQADSTVNSVTGKRTSRASADDIAINNPYNTYKVRGLPPGPIGSVSLDAIRAAVNPAPTPYLYFLTTPDGVTVFSRTFDEHVAAKVRWYP